MPPFTRSPRLSVWAEGPRSSQDRRLHDSLRAFIRYILTGDSGDRLEPWIRTGGHLSPEARLEIYRGAYYVRLEIALAHDYPALLAFAGDRAFGRLAVDYLRDHPSTTPSIRWVGEEMKAWLNANGHAPALADLAALEWAIVGAFDAADAPAAKASELAALAPENWPELRLELHPSLSLLFAQTNAREIWMAVRGSQALPASRPVREVLAVWRAESGPAVVPIDEPGRILLATFGEGATFGAGCEAMAASLPVRTVPEVAANRLYEAVCRGILIWPGQVPAAAPSPDQRGSPRDCRLPS